jgi:hypothetical protein
MPRPCLCVFCRDKDGDFDFLGRGRGLSLSGKPLAQPILYIVLRDSASLLGVFEALAHLIEDVEMVLDVLKRTVLGEFV